MSALPIAVFLLAASFVFYALIGYPLLLLVWGKLAPRPIRRRPFTPMVSVIIPVRNGAAWIEAKLNSVFALDYPPGHLQVIVASDGSTDNTVALARAFSGVEVLELPAGGKCQALNAAIAQARHEVIFFTDVRQPLDARCLASLCACLSDPEVGVVSGELVILPGDRAEHARIGLYVRFEEWLRKQISLVGSIAGATGAVYAMRRSLVSQLPPDILLDDVYQPVAAYFQGARVVLDGEAIAYDYPTAMRSEFGRKVRTLAGLFQIIAAFPRLLWPGHDIWIHFVSHKLTRLLLPYAFLAILLSSFALPEPGRSVLLAAQATFYGLALLDFWIPEGFPLKRLSSLTRTFLTLLAAAAAAGKIMFRPARTLWLERR